MRKSDLRSYSSQHPGSCRCDLFSGRLDVDLTSEVYYICSLFTLKLNSQVFDVGYSYLYRVWTKTCRTLDFYRKCKILPTFV